MLVYEVVMSRAALNTVWKILRLCLNVRPMTKKAKTQLEAHSHILAPG